MEYNKFQSEIQEERMQLVKLYSKEKTFEEFKIKATLQGLPKYKENAIWKFYFYYLLKSRNINSIDFRDCYGFNIFALHTAFAILVSVIVSFVFRCDFNTPDFKLYNIFTYPKPILYTFYCFVPLYFIDIVWSFFASSYMKFMVDIEVLNMNLLKSFKWNV